MQLKWIVSWKVKIKFISPVSKPSNYTEIFSEKYFYGSSQCFNSLVLSLQFKDKRVQELSISDVVLTNLRKCIM